MSFTRILGIDYGDKRIGLALSDPLGIIASGLGVYGSTTMTKDIDAIAAIAKQNDAKIIVIGLPINMDGTEGERASKTRAFGKNLSKVSGLEVIYKDERLTTISAHKAMTDVGVAKKNQYKSVDTISAQLILQSYLDSKRY